MNTTISEPRVAQESAAHNKRVSIKSIHMDIDVIFIDFFPQEYWHVRVVNKDGSFGEEGLIPSTHVELKSKHDSIIDLDENLSKKVHNMEQRDKVMEEMVQTEEKYIEQLRQVKLLTNYDRPFIE